MQEQGSNSGSHSVCFSDPEEQGSNSESDTGGLPQMPAARNPVACNHTVTMCRTCMQEQGSNTGSHSVCFSYPEEQGSNRYGTSRFPLRYETSPSPVINSMDQVIKKQTRAYPKYEACLQMAAGWTSLDGTTSQPTMHIAPL
eukprot:scaffold26714_cov74-Attheya_sp.AAC.2